MRRRLLACANIVRLRLTRTGRRSKRGQTNLLTRTLPCRISLLKASRGARLWLRRSNSLRRSRRVSKSKLGLLINKIRIPAFRGTSNLSITITTLTYMILEDLRNKRTTLVLSKIRTMSTLMARSRLLSSKTIITVSHTRMRSLQSMFPCKTLLLLMKKGSLHGL